MRKNNSNSQFLFIPFRMMEWTFSEPMWETNGYQLAAPVSKLGENLGIVTLKDYDMPIEMAKVTCRSLCESDPKGCCNVVFVNDWENGYYLCEKYTGVLNHEMEFKTDIIDRTSYWRKECIESKLTKELG